MQASSAFDGHRPPEMDLIEDCVHCGFCLPTCPTYVLWGEEMDSPRGRIVLMRAGLEQDSTLSGSMVQHFDNCLGCMACVTACPSGVKYDRLIEQTRPQVERNFERSRAERAFRRAVFSLFTRPATLRALAPLAAGGRKVIGARGDRLLKRWPRLASLQSLAPSTSVKEAWTRLPERVVSVGQRRGRVALLQGCVQRVFFGRVNAATAHVLAAEGWEVLTFPSVRCCGALMLHTGYEEEAKVLARRAVKAFEGCDFVAVNAAGCGSAMKDYGFLLDDDPEYAERATAMAGKVKDVSELLAEHEPRAERKPLRLKVAYHDACHLAHAQGVRVQPRSLLRSIPGIELLEPAEWEICCGSAGIYNLLNPPAADELGARKANNILGTSPEAIAAGNPGCALQIDKHLRTLGKEIPVYHPMELLAASIDGRRL